MRTVAQIKAEIKEQLGLYPSFFVPAELTPDVLETLWQQTRLAYLNNPLPTLLKQKIFVTLSEYCHNFHTVLYHLKTLQPLQMVVIEILELTLKNPVSELRDVSQALARLTQTKLSNSVLARDIEIQECLIRCCIYLFSTQTPENSLIEPLRQCLGYATYTHLISLICYIKLFEQWIESYPELLDVKNPESQSYPSNLFDHETSETLENLNCSGSLSSNFSLSKPVNSDNNLFSGLSTPLTDLEPETDHYSKEQLKAVIEAIPGFVSWVTKEGKYVGVNRQLAALFNLPPKIFRNQEVGKIHGSSQFSKFVHQFLKSQKVNDSQIVESEVKGEQRYYLVATQKYQQDTAAVIVGIDITQQKQMEAKLQESQTLLQTILDHSTAVIFVKDLEGRYLFINKQFELLFDCELENFKGKTDWEIFPEAIAQALRKNDQIVVQSKTSIVREEVLLQNNEAHTYISVKFPLLDSQGKLYATCSIATDITDRKQIEKQLRQAHDELEIKVVERTQQLAFINQSLQSEISEHQQTEAALQQSEARLKLALNATNTGIWDWNLITNKLIFSENIKIILGWKSLRFSKPKHTYLKLTYPEDRDDLLTTIKNAIRTRSKFEIQHRIFWPDGSLHWLEAKGQVLENKQGKPVRVVGTLIDITHRKRESEEICLLQTVTQAISEAPDFYSALEVTLTHVSQTLGWHFGEAWVFSEKNNTLILSPAWYSSLPRLREFRKASEAFTFSEEISIPGRIFASKQPEWQRDVSSLPASSFLRVNVAQKVGLKAALGVPILANEQVIAVLVFFKLEADSPDKRLIDLIVSIANQLGLIIQRKKTEVALRESEHRLSAIFNQAAVGIAQLDATGRWILVNQKFCEIMGYSPQELLTQTFDEFIHPDDRTITFSEYQRLLREQPNYSVEKRYLRKDGSSIWTNITISIINDDLGTPTFTAIIEDISERKNAEQEIKQLNETLESRVKERTAQLEAINQELEAFSYSVSHDLRAPLRRLDGFSQALLNFYSEQLDSRAQHYLERIRASSQHMGELIDDLLTLSRVTRVQMQRQVVNLSTIAWEVANELKMTQPERNVEFIIASGLTINGDSRLLRLVLENLLQNAWKYTSHHPTAKIEVGCQLPENGEPIYFVRDDGAGFDMTYANKLFRAFQRLHSETEFPGTGIGLATIQRIIHRHGGQIWVEAAIEQGATFFFQLD
jgi:PAS domain S-box-containing protein